MNSQSLTRGIAFFSVGLGLAELLAPRQLARLIGVDEDNENLLRALGLRELGSGVGIMQGNAGAFLWSRVGGDAIDLGLLAVALNQSKRRNRQRVIGAIAAVAGVTALDIAAALLASRNPAQPDWRVKRDDRSGMPREDPLGLRRYSDATMAAHASGHLREIERAAANNEYATTPDQTETHETAAAQQFEPGD
jgi:hypothetical protein